MIYKLRPQWGSSHIVFVGISSVLQLIRRFVQKITGKTAAEAPAEPEGEDCCSGVVHIAYRGLSDDRQYVAYSRKWEELRFFKENGLKVFCADCRRRLL